MEIRRVGADVEAPIEALMHGEWRVGNRQDNNFYVQYEGVEYYIGVGFWPSYGPAMRDRLNATLDTPSETGDANPPASR